MELVKTAVKVGNSAGVLLPKAWLNAEVKVVLEPLNVKRGILEILEENRILQNVMGIYIIGSYAKNEQTIESDVDVLVVTSRINKKIKKGKYEIICVSKREVERQLEENALPILAMLKEAKAIINEDLIKDYVKRKLNKKNLKWHIETTKSAMGVVKADTAFSKEVGIEASDASAYSLILRLRTLYIIDCIRKKKIWKKKEFLGLVRKISGSLNAYERYLSSKNKNTLDHKLPLEEAIRLMKHINKETEKLERCLKGKRD